ncbi:MAG: glycosyltransferase family 2 protein [Anaerolineae bacterium]|nr:glycosyltransferase family 2 protein [Anaerolineae bacterium]MDW8172436.1 glycosyltransferase family 2 protein [Anaerolineae bacterium]
MVDVAVVIVTWNVAEIIGQALSSVLDDLQASGLSWRVLLVDSASTDDTLACVQAFPQVECLASTENLGFGRANNLAMRHLGFGQPGVDGLPRAVYLLNPDTISQPGSVRALYDTLMADPSLGLVGAALRFGDGSFQHAAFTFPGLRQLWAEFFPTPGRLIESRWNGRYPRASYESGRPFEVDFTLGATMMLRAEVVQQVGMFDEQFFMYCEEVDWAWRIRRAGWRIACVPSALVIHLGGQSTGKACARSTFDLWRSRLLLFRKHYPAWKLELARRMIVLGIARRRRALAQDKRHSPSERAELAAAYDQIVRMTKE